MYAFDALPIDSLSRPSREQPRAFHRRRGEEYPREAIAALLALLIGFATSPALATILVPLNVEQMTSMADDIVHGDVAKVESHWDDNHEVILTYVSVRSKETLKGRALPEQTFVYLGGSDGKVTVRVEGQPTFQQGEEVVVFLRRMPSRKRLAVATDAWLLGLGQGKWTLTGKEPGPRKATSAVSADMPTLPRAGGPAEREMDAATLFTRIRAAVKATAVPPGKAKTATERPSSPSVAVAAGEVASAPPIPPPALGATTAAIPAPAVTSLQPAPSPQGGGERAALADSSEEVTP